MSGAEIGFIVAGVAGVFAAIGKSKEDKEKREIHRAELERVRAEKKARKP